MTSDRRSRAVASLRGLAVGDALGSCFFIPDNLPALCARALPSDLWWWPDDSETACSVFAILGRCGRIDQDALDQLADAWPTRVSLEFTAAMTAKRIAENSALVTSWNSRSTSGS